MDSTALHLTPAAAPLPLAYRTTLSWPLDVLAAHLRTGATLSAGPGGYELRAADGSLIEAAPRLDEMALALAARLRALPGKAQTVVRLPAPLLAGFYSVRWMGESLSAFLRVAAAHEIERRRALLDEEGGAHGNA